MEKNIKSVEGVSFEDVDTLMKLGNPTIINGISMGYKVETCGDSCSMSVWKNCSTDKITKKGKINPEAPYAYGWYKLLYQCVCDLIMLCKKEK